MVRCGPSAMMMCRFNHTYLKFLPSLIFSSVQFIWDSNEKLRTAIRRWKMHENNVVTINEKWHQHSSHDAGCANKKFLITWRAFEETLSLIKNYFFRRASPNKTVNLIADMFWEKNEDGKCRVAVMLTSHEYLFMVYVAAWEKCNLRTSIMWQCGDKSIEKKLKWWETLRNTFALF